MGALESGSLEIPYVLNPRYMAWDEDWFQNVAHLNSPALKKGGYSGFGLSAITSILHSVRHSIRHNVSAQYLENNLIEFHKNLYISTRSWLGLLHIFFLTFVIELWPLTDVRISFSISYCSIS